jgi:uncharacterized membrane protein YiaA
MPFLKIAWRSLWFLAVGLHGLLTFVAIRRGFQREFPVFVCYTSWVTLEGIILLYMYYAPSVSGNEYFVASMLGLAICAVARFAIVYEIFKHLLKRYPALSTSGTFLFRLVTVSLLGVVILLAKFSPPAGSDPLMSSVFSLQTTVNVVLVGLLLFIFVFSGFFQLSWRSHAFGIALGLGIFGTVSLSTSAIRAQLQPIVPNQMTNLTEVINQGTYVICALIWLAYLLATERPPQTPKPRPPKHDLNAWNQELQRFLQR